jgi:hypothetical protein
MFQRLYWLLVSPLLNTSGSGWIRMSDLQSGKGELVQVRSQSGRQLGLYKVMTSCPGG